MTQPLTIHQRIANYQKQSAKMTPRQRRRIVKKERRAQNA